jgi:MFS family permease
MYVLGGYSDGAGAAIVAMFSALMAVGRILGGFITPRVGEVNMLLLGLFIPGFMGLTVWMAAPTNIITTSITAVIWVGFLGFADVSGC